MDFEELYQELILEHARHPRNLGDLPAADRHVHGNNPMCGDEITLHVKFGPDGGVEDVRFTGNGCSICMASASLLTQKVKAQSAAGAAALAKAFSAMLLSEQEITPDPRLGDLRALAGVRKFPLRVKCATLAWHALEQALAPGGPSEREFADE